MKKLIFVFLVFLAMVGTVSAQSVTFTAQSDEAIDYVTIQANGGTSGTVSFETANGSTITGSFSYLSTGGINPLANTAIITLGGNTNSLVYNTPGEIYITTAFYGSVFNITDSRASMSAGQSVLASNIEVIAPFYSPIVSYTVNADHTVVVTHKITDRKAVEAALDATSVWEIVEQARDAVETLWTVLSAIMFWVKFLLIDNIVMLVCLYLFGTMAYAMNKSKNIFAFFTTWFRQQSQLFHFVVSTFSSIVTALGSLI